MLFLLGKVDNHYIELSDYSLGTPLTSNCNLRHKSGVLAIRHNSYVEPNSSNILVLYENGYIDINSDYINYYSPILNIDEATGRCIDSPLVDCSLKDWTR